MSVCCHRDEVYGFGAGCLNQLRRWIAKREHSARRKPCRVQPGYEALEVGSVTPHLIRFAKIQVFEMASRPALGDVHQEERCPGELGKLLGVPEDRVIRMRVFDGDKDVPVHALTPRMSEPAASH